MRVRTRSVWQNDVGSNKHAAGAGVGNGNTPMNYNNAYVNAIPRTLLFIVGLVLNTIAAVFGTAALSVAVGFPIPAHSVSQALFKTLLLSITLAATSGFLVYRAWETVTAKWVWILPAALFALRVLGILLTPRDQSVLLASSSSWATAWTQMSGVACADGWHTLGCLNFTLFTTSLVSTVSYSIGALLCEKQFHKQAITRLQ
jgi:hypothetical protein